MHHASTPRVRARVGACVRADISDCAHVGQIEPKGTAAGGPRGNPAAHLLPDRRHRAHTWTGESVSADALQVEPYGAEELRVVLTHRKQAQASLERMAKAQQAACVED
jgi:hypothetical protein